MSITYYNHNNLNTIDYNITTNHTIIDNNYIILNNINKGLKIINNDIINNFTINTIFCVIKTTDIIDKFYIIDTILFNPSNTYFNITDKIKIYQFNNLYVIQFNINIVLSSTNIIKLFHHDTNIFNVQLYELIVCYGNKNMNIINTYLLNKYTKNMHYYFDYTYFNIYSHIIFYNILNSIPYKNISIDNSNNLISNDSFNNSKNFPNNNLSYYATSNNNIDILSIPKICSINSDDFSICGFENGLIKSVLDFKNTINNTSIKLNINTDIIINNKLLDSNNNSGNSNKALASTNDGKLIWENAGLKTFNTTDDLLNANITRNGTVATVLNPTRLWIYNNSEWSSLHPIKENFSIIHCDFSTYYLNTNNIIDKNISFKNNVSKAILYNINSFIIANINIIDDMKPNITYTENTNISTTGLTGTGNPSNAIYINNNIYNYKTRINSLTSVKHKIPYKLTIKDTNTINIIEKSFIVDLNKVPIIYASLPTDADSTYSGILETTHTPKLFAIESVKYPGKFMKYVETTDPGRTGGNISVSYSSHVATWYQHYVFVDVEDISLVGNEYKFHREFQGGYIKNLADNKYNTLQHNSAVPHAVSSIGQALAGWYYQAIISANGASDEFIIDIAHGWDYKGVIGVHKVNNSYHMYCVQYLESTLITYDSTTKAASNVPLPHKFKIVWLEPPTIPLWSDFIVTNILTTFTSPLITPGNKSNSNYNGSGPFPEMRTYTAGLSTSDGSLSLANSNSRLFGGYNDRTYVWTPRAATGYYFNGYDFTKIFSMSSSWDNSCNQTFTIYNADNSKKMQLFSINYSGTSISGYSNNGYTNNFSVTNITNSNIEFTNTSHIGNLQTFYLESGTHTISVPNKTLIFYYLGDPDNKFTFV